jgi:group I intron endonuclease
MDQKKRRSHVRNCACYILTHVPTGRFYIGSTGDMLQRKWDHVKTLRKQIHTNPTLNKIYRDGDELSYEIFLTETRQEAYILEQELLQQCWGDPLLLNVSENVYGYAPGHRHSAEVIAKIASKRGPAHHMYGVPKSEEWRRKIGDGNRGKVVSPETRALLSAVGKGRNTGAESVHSAPVSIDGVEYASIGIAAKTLGIAECTIRRRLARNYPNWIRLKPKRAW